MIGELRHLIGVVVLVVYGSGLFFWFLIHPWVRFWRRMGPPAAYATTLVLLAALGALIYRVRLVLLGRDLGTHPIPLALGALLLVVLIWMGSRYGWASVHLSARTRMGLPELSGDRSRDRLVQEGPYSVVRHPIYASAAAAGIALGLIVNHAGVYLFFLAAIPALVGITLIEERELIDRFGEEYREYRRHVPRLIPQLPRGRRS